jgi:hypothetical protein
MSPANLPNAAVSLPPPGGPPVAVPLQAVKHFSGQQAVKHFPYGWLEKTLVGLCSVFWTPRDSVIHAGSVT